MEESFLHGGARELDLAGPTIADDNRTEQYPVVRTKYQRHCYAIEEEKTLARVNEMYK